MPFIEGLYQPISKQTKSRNNRAALRGGPACLFLRYPDLVTRCEGFALRIFGGMAPVSEGWETKRPLNELVAQGCVRFGAPSAIPRQVASPQSLTPLHRTTAF